MMCVFSVALKRFAQAVETCPFADDRAIMQKVDLPDLYSILVSRINQFVVWCHSKELPVYGIDVHWSLVLKRRLWRSKIDVPLF